jgi:hypothetical protein
MEALIRPIRNSRHVTVLYRIILEVSHVTLIITLVADDAFPNVAAKAEGGMRFAFPPYGYCPPESPAPPFHFSFCISPAL